MWREKPKLNTKWVAGNGKLLYNTVYDDEIGVVFHVFGHGIGIEVDRCAARAVGL